MTASNWVEDDLPLSYEFGYESFDGLFLSIRSISQLSDCQSDLPSSSRDDGRLSLLVHVLDSLGGVSESSKDVDLSGSVSSTSDILSWLTGQLDTSISGADDMLRVISVASSSVNHSIFAVL